MHSVMAAIKINCEFLPLGGSIGTGVLLVLLSLITAGPITPQLLEQEKR
jgi:hypothetical protein